jgi:hypothetical protein
MNKSLNKKILEQIQDQKIQPTSKWNFKLREMLLWIGIGISLLLASFSVGSFIFQSVNSLLLPPHLHVWFAGIRIFLIILFITLAVFQILRTRKGYKRKYSLYLFIGFLLIGISGSVFFATRTTGIIERSLGSAGLIERGNNYWSEPETTGLLAGELIEITNEGYLLCEALDESLHVLDIISIDNKDIFIDFLRVQMVGYEQDGVYYPCSVQPWRVRLAGPERDTEYGVLENGNIEFRKQNTLRNNFIKTFERKSEIIRTNSC